MPKVLAAGADAGVLTEKGARLIDPRKAEARPLCPPEGDAGTGMVATNSIARYTGNVSAGTSVFAMFVLDKELKRYTRKSIWLQPLQVIWLPWYTATTAAPSLTPGSPCLRNIR